MSDDLVAPQEVFEPDSSRDVLLFCAVLLVEIYSLSVAFGGPYLEVGYFLLVVTSQTIAGAYIWARLREHECILPLPELLAMGFAIGSASAATTQLVIRDLLGIRLFISPLIPVIAVLTWRTFKQNVKLPVQISHAKTKTLLWLLFPAPLALSFFVWQLLLIFVVPMVLVAIAIYKGKFRGYFVTSLSVTALAAIFGIFTYHFQKFSIAISMVGWDEIFDEAHAIGFTNWGIGENIGWVGDPVGYYKFSHIWLGPILELTHAPPMIISTSVMLISIFTAIGLGLWTLTYQTHKSSIAAGIGAVLIFVQHSLPEPLNLPIRIAQCLVIVYLLAGLTAISKLWNSTLETSLVIAAVVFITFSTRSQYGLIIFSAILLKKFVSLIRREATLRKTIIEVLPSCLAIILFNFIFLNYPRHNIGTTVGASLFGMSGLFVGYLGVRTIIPLIAIHKSRLNSENFLIYVIFSAGIIYFIIPQYILSGSSEWTIASISTILIAPEVVSLSKTLPKKILLGIFTLTCLTGAVMRLAFDLYKWKEWKDLSDLDNLLGVFARFSTFGTNSIFQTMLPFLLCIVLIFCTIKIQKVTIQFRSVVVLAALSITFGISLATMFRTVTNHYRYNQRITTVIEDDTPMSWYTQEPRINALRWLKENTNRDEIFAQNTLAPNYQTTEYFASRILSGATHRRAYAEGRGRTRQTQSENEITQLQSLRDDLNRLETSYYFPINPSGLLLEKLKEANVKWFVVDLGNTSLRSWEPWATTRFMNEKVAILELENSTISEAIN